MAWTVKIDLNGHGYRATGTRTVGEDVTSYSVTGALDGELTKYQQAVIVMNAIWDQHAAVVAKAASDAAKLGTIEADIAAALDAKET